MDLNQIILPIIYIIAAAIAVVVLVTILQTRFLKGRIVRALNMKLFLVTLPKEMPKSNEGQPQKTDKEKIAVAEQLFSNLAQIKPKGLWHKLYYGPPYIVFEIAVPFVGEEICFYGAVPKGYEGFIEKQIQGFYPTASVEFVKDYNIFGPGAEVCGGYFSLSKKYILPFRTYQNLEADPMWPITNALSKITGNGEGGALQLVLRPAKHGWNRLGVKVVRSMAEGRSFGIALSKQSVISQTKDFFETSKKPGQGGQPEPQKVLSPIDEETMKALKEKASKPGFEVNVRILTATQSKERSGELLSHVKGSFDQFNSPTLNTVKFHEAKRNRLKRLIYSFSFRLFDEREKFILSSDELASIFHFPLSTLETPRIKWLKAKPAAAPANLPTEGLILGRNVYRGEERVVRIKRDDRRRHIYIIGQTGTGKSVFMQNMIKQDIENGEGVAVLDPHGDLVEKILTFIPKERAEDVIYFNPPDTERPMGLNMLEFNPKYPEQKGFAVNEMINIFDKLYDLKLTGGPIFEQYARNAMLLVLEDPESGSTLFEVPRVLADSEFRKYKLERCKNFTVKHFWEKEAEKAGGESALANVVPYVTSKMNMFLSNDIMRPIVCQQHSSFDFRKIMDEKKIFLANLTKGKLGDSNSSLLGLIITGKFLMAALSRIDIPEEKREDYFLYLDEFQNFTTESISTILAEARKYRLGLNIAHQFIGQLEDKIKLAVFGNVGSMVSFRIGPEDAEFVVKQFEPVFSQNDLININNFNAYLKLLIDGQTTRPFNILTYPPEKGDEEAAKMAKELSRLKYGRDKAAVEKEILERFNISESKSKWEEFLPEEPAR